MDSYDFINATVRNTGGASITIQSATLDGKSAALETTGDNTGGFVIAKGESGAFLITPPATVELKDGAQYTVKLTTAKGTTIVATAVYSVP